MDKKELKRQTRKLIREAQKGNIFARNKAVMLNEKLVRHYINKIPPHPHVSKDDDYQNGILGVMHAIEKFDLSKGIAFSTYAVFWISEKIQYARLKNFGTVQFPTNAMKSGYKPLNEKSLDYVISHENGWQATLGDITPDESLFATDFLCNESIRHGIEEERPKHKYVSWCSEGYWRVTIKGKYVGISTDIHVAIAKRDDHLEKIEMTL